MRVSIPALAALTVAAALAVVVVGAAKPEAFKPPAEAVPPRSDGVVTNVHIVCHTHDDVGWLKTVDQYYMGANNSIQMAGVQYVLDSVMPSLEANPKRKFIYVEIAFFIRYDNAHGTGACGPFLALTNCWYATSRLDSWWREQTPQMQARVSKLVSNGQLEFINGGWCMNDEAATHYYDIVDQMTRGHAFLLETFGVKPTIGWHIDPFGHSAAQAELFSLMKFDAFFFGRIDYQDKTNRLATQQMEVMWRPSSSLGASAQIFAGVTFNGYGPPDGFNWDVFQQDQPIQDDPRLEDVNVGERADAFAAWVRWAASYYATPNIMLTMGSDFQYTNANTWYKNLDKLINYMTGKPQYADLNLMYSTPSIYLKYVNAANPVLTVKTDDFFPYSDWEHAMWTGYFTSRVALKGYVRQQSSYLQTCKQLEVMVPNTPSQATSQRLIDAMAVAQHHDAVSGTSKQHVAYDYAKRLSIGQADCATLTGEAISKLSSTNGASVTFTQCPLLNVSVCTPTNQAQTGSLAVVFYNNLGRARSEWVRLPVNSNSWSVSDANGAAVPSQFTYDYDAAAKYWLVFEIEVPQFGFATYFLTGGGEGQESEANIRAAAAEPAAPTTEVDEESDQSTVTNMENAYLRFTFTGGSISSITNKVSGVTVNVNQSIMWYTPSKGSPDDSQASGAYIFRPEGDAAVPNALPAPTLSIASGPLVQEATMTFGSWATQIIRLYADAQTAEIEYTIGPIDISDKIGKEVITRWITDWSCDNTFWSDSNGREMQKRVINYRPTWPLQVFEPVAGNYYPMNSAAGLVNNIGTGALLFLNDRSQGVGGVVDGELEVMLHRRLLADDSRGVGEPLNETYNGVGLIVRTKHILLLDTPDHVGTLHRVMAENVANPVNPLFTAISSPQAYMSSHVGNWSALAAALPTQIHLQTVQQLAGGKILLRIEHMFESNQSSIYSVPVTVNLQQIFFPVFGKSSAVEYSLSANQPVGGTDPTYEWTTVDSPQSEVNKHSPPAAVGGEVTSVTLYPMQIRTFILS